MSSIYSKLGVSSSKSDVKNIVSYLDAGIFPGAFCKAIPDVLSGSPDHCLVMHADGCGTKSGLAYLYAKHCSNNDVFYNLAHDVISMNLDDLLCVGATGPFIFNNTIGRNSSLIGKDAIEAVILGLRDISTDLKEEGIEIHFCGGETADVGDLVRTLLIDVSMICSVKKSNFINCSNVKIDDCIVGLSSSGQASYEKVNNSGIGSNGLTAARHRLLKSDDSYNGTFSPDIEKFAHSGEYTLSHFLDNGMTLGEALLSPTRIYAPILIRILSRFSENISAIFHNTGGGQTKCMNFGQGIHYVKDNMFELPTLFSFIKQNASMPIKELYQVFNMGHRIEIVCDESIVDDVIAISNSFNVDAKIVGRVRKNSDPAKNKLTIKHDDYTIEY